MNLSNLTKPLVYILLVIVSGVNFLFFFQKEKYEKGFKLKVQENVLLKSEVLELKHYLKSTFSSGLVLENHPDLEGILVYAPKGVYGACIQELMNRVNLRQKITSFLNTNLTNWSSIQRKVRKQIHLMN